MSAANGPLLAASGLRKEFAVRGRRLGPPLRLQALAGVDLELARGECLAVVGESGSGKTTLARCLVRLVEPTAGTIVFQGEDLLALSAADLRRRRRFFQMVFQDPYGSLNPRLRVGEAVAEAMAVHGLERGGRRVAAVLEMAGLGAAAGGRYPHQLSGGERQRVGIARALASGPRLLVADEPVSALDVSVRAQIVNLLARLQRDLDLSLLFIAHDLALVEQLADRVAVLYLGRIVEQGPRAELFARPLHPYTASLLSAVPLAEPDPSRRRERILLAGEPPSPLDPPGGCPFHPRCPIARPRCASDDPPLRELAAGRLAACHYPGELQPPAAVV